MLAAVLATAKEDTSHVSCKAGHVVPVLSELPCSGRAGSQFQPRRVDV